MEVFSSTEKGRECLPVQIDLRGPHTAVNTPDASGDPRKVLPEAHPELDQSRSTANTVDDLACWRRRAGGNLHQGLSVRLCIEDGYAGKGPSKSYDLGD